MYPYEAPCFRGRAVRESSILVQLFPPGLKASGECRQSIETELSNYKRDESYHELPDCCSRGSHFFFFFAFGCEDPQFAHNIQFDIIREIFACTTESERRGYTAGHFSFNIPGGRCETCQGDGTVTVEMQFLADVELICEECKGTRYKSTILDVRYHGLNIHEVLKLTIREALAFFADQPKLVSRLKPMADVGLGYLRLGQSATTLSGGEAQRVKLASHLTQKDSKGMLYLFDEPTTGLHFDDIAKLLDAFERLVQNGASLLIIEHNLEVIRHADWLIDLGPEGGGGGGQIVAVGTPEQVSECRGSYTARFLREMKLVD